MIMSLRENRHKGTWYIFLRHRRQSNLFHQRQLRLFGMVCNHIVGEHGVMDLVDKTENFMSGITRTMT